MREVGGGRGAPQPPVDALEEERRLFDALRRKRQEPSARIDPTLAPAAGRHGIDGLLGEGDPAWRPWVDTVRYHSMVLTNLSARVSAALRGAEVPHAILKGAVTAAVAWELPELRPQTDVDLLVTPADAQRAIDALASDGLVTPTAAWSWQHATALQVIETGAWIDLHHATGVDAPLGVPTEQLLSQVVQVPTFAGPLPSLAPIDALLVVATHASRHLHERIGWLVDVHGSIHRSGIAGSEQLAARAMALGVAVATAFALDAAARGFDDPACARAVRALGVSERRLRALRAFREAGLAGPPAGRRAANLATRVLLPDNLRDFPGWLQRKLSRRRGVASRG